jgi:hypothetical protein
MDGEIRSPSIQIAIVYRDLPDLIQLQTSVRIGPFSGMATAYTSPNSLRQQANSLRRWAAMPDGLCRIEAGADTAGCLLLRFYTVDIAAHTACHVTIATDAAACGRPEAISRLSTEMQTEPGLIDKFARQLLALLDAPDTQAVLEGVNG